MVNETAEILLSFSTDGLEWAEPSQITDNENVDVFPTIYRGVNGELWTAWTSNVADPFGDIVTGARDRDLIRLTTMIRPEYSPRIAPAGEDGCYLLAWVSDTEGNLDIFVRAFRQ